MAAPILRLSQLLKNCRKENIFLHSILRWNNSRRYASSSSAEEAAETISEGFHNEVKSVLRRTEVSGLYGFDVLKSAKGFRTFVEEAIVRSEELIACIKDLPPSAETIHAMDEISDTICTVVDSAELCRNTHPDKDYVEEANMASLKLYEYLHHLNTNHMLYNAVVESEQQGCLKTEEAQRAAKTLRIDFEKGGIHLCKKKLERVNELNLTITQLGREFGENILRDPGQVDIYPASRIPKCLQNQLDRIQRRISSDARKGFSESGFRIITEPGILSSVLKWTPDADIRKQAYITGHSVPEANLNVLDKLISSRHDLAQILGYKSYAEFALTSTMASSPDVVISFLHDMSNMVKKKADEGMIDAVSICGAGFKAPTEDELSGPLLLDMVEEMKLELEDHKKIWSQKGCTIMTDGWTDRRSRTLLNFLVSSEGSTMFLRSIDASSRVKNAKFLCETIEEVIREVGEDNVVQVVTDNAANYVAAGKLLMERHPKIFWTPCAAHCIDLMLEDIGKLVWVKSVVTQAKNLCKFIYNHALVLSTMRQYTKGKELARPGITRFASNFITLKSLLSSRLELRCMFVGPEWSSSSFATSPAGIDATKCIYDDEGFWEPCSKIVEEVHSISEYKKQVSNKVDGSVEPWDEAYYTGMMKSSACNLESAVIASYFPLSQCLEGLNVVVRSLFGASFDRVPMAPGESWHPEVQKLILHHPIEGDLGCMYLDLYVRKGKYPGCAHFAIKGGRRLSETEYQLPIVALVCNFPSPARSSQAMLNHWELETLFHEFGHAIHSLLSRTDYQHFSGTRTVIDFAETPANLFEYFAWDYRVLKQFAKHYSTGDAIPEELVLSMNKARKMFAATDLQRQIFFSMIDQTLFGEQPLHGRDTRSIVADLKQKYTSWKHVEGTHWHTRFNHLVNYGAGYYSYLYAKCFAASLWQKVCLEDPLSLETGSILRNEIIKYGGAKDPSILLRDSLGERVIKAYPSGGVMPNKDDLLQELNL